VKDQFYKFITLLATIAFFVPVLIVLVKKLWQDKYFLFLGAYWLIGALVNIITLIPGIGSRTLEIIIVIYNLMDILFILWILWYTSSSTAFAKILRIVIVVFFLIELLLLFSFGINYEAIKYIMGAGVLVVLVTLVWEIRLYLQRMEHNNREKSMLFIYAALLFEYGSYIIVYILDYFIIRAAHIDTFLIYYISTLIAIMIASFGFLIRKNKDALVFK